MKAFKGLLQHHLNVLHVYCALCPYLGCKEARRLASRWEHSNAYRFLYIHP